ncbi:MAG TPA: hypothetical protein VN310_04045 [Candidatus Dormibacteraeota bacterium]|jgi:hypothetical protein|nr:hypothetical protein [Candidatus Dormibacteraeota bacterium]
MLPDIPETKGEILNRITTAIKRKIDADHPILAGIKSITQHEGVIHQHDQIGFGTVSEGYREIGAPVKIDLDEVPDLIREKLDQKLTGIANEIGKQQMQMFFRTLDEATEKAGTRLDNKGKPMTADTILQLIEMTEVDFDRSGKPTSSFVLHPDMMETAKKIDQQIKNDPDLKARAEAIRRRHYESWLARENNRKLVD